MTMSSFLGFLSGAFFSFCIAFSIFFEHRDFILHELQISTPLIGSLHRYSHVIDLNTLSTTLPTDSISTL